MKRHSFLLALLTLFCVGCGEQPTPVIDNPDNNNVETEDPIFVPNCRENYNEPADAVDGVARNDFDDLRTALGKANHSYNTLHETFLNEECKNYYKINYSEDMIDRYFSTYGNTELFTEDNFIFEDTYRLSKAKYEINNQDAVNRVISVVYPNLKNEGYFLTFKRATIELDNDNNLYRFRVYVNTTQIGKLIDSHQKQENTNWYLLFGQCYFLSYVEEELTSK